MFLIGTLDFGYAFIVKVVFMNGDSVLGGEFSDCARKQLDLGFAFSFEASKDSCFYRAC